jgi:bacteriophage protein of unknown function (DUF646)
MSADFYFENLDEFKDKLNAVVNEYTETAEKHLKRAGNKLKKLAKENSPVKSGKLSKSWNGKITGISTDEIQYELKNKSKVYHLVERGHTQKDHKGNTIGFVQGKHFFENTVQEFQNSDVMQTELQKFFDDIKNKLS